METYRHHLMDADRFIKENDDFLIVSHIQPDGDATGSALAVAGMLASLGKTFTLVNEGHTPEKFGFLPFYERIHSYTEAPLSRTYRNVIAVDCADRERVGTVAEAFAEDGILLNIDHHPTNDHYGDVNVVKDTACATAEVLYELTEVMDLRLNESIATCLYTGILTDTGGFRYANTKPEVLHMASKLLEHNVSPAEVAEKCLETVTYAHTCLLKESLGTLDLDIDGRMAMMIVTDEMKQRNGASKDDMDGLVNYARNIEGVEVGVLLKEQEKGEIKASFRSNTYVDVAAIASTFGGGGHVRASGCTIHADMATAKQQVKAEIQDAFNQTQAL